MTKTILISMLICLALPTLVRAAELLIDPSSTTITSEENLSIDLTVKTEGNEGEPETPQFDAPDFEIVNQHTGLMSGSSISISIGGGSFQNKITRSSQTTVVLSPKREGKLVIKNIRVQVGKRLIRAQDLEIEVMAANSTAGRARRQNLSGGGGMGSLYPPKSNLFGSGTRGQKIAQGDILIKTEASKLKVYKGEQVIVTYALYTRKPIGKIAVERYPNPQGFLKEDMDIPLTRGMPPATRTVLGGREYYRAVLAQYALYPLETGNLSIDPLTAKVGILASQGNLNDDDFDPFGIATQLFMNRTIDEKRTSDRLSIEVIPLPQSDQPKDFSGLVGDFEITAVADKTSLRTGESLNVKVKVEGAGHVGMLEKLATQWPEGFELYEDKANSQFYKTGNSEKVFDYLVIPRKAGRFQIPSFVISAYSPNMKAYQVRKTEPIAVDVQQGDASTVSIPSTRTQNAQIITPSKSVPDAIDLKWRSDAGSGLFSRVWAFVASLIRILGILIFAVVLFVVLAPKFSIFAQKWLGVQKARRKIDWVRDAKATKNSSLSELENFLERFILDKYGISVHSTTRSEIRENLELNYKVDTSLAVRVERLLEACENERFAPSTSLGSNSSVNVSKLRDELISLIERLS